MSESSANFDELRDKYGSPDAIPSNELYKFLDENRENLENLSKIEDIPASILGQEVRRRCIFDLKWMAQYFLWDAMPASDNGTRPVEENIFLDSQYDVVWDDFFYRKDPAIPIHKLDTVKTKVLLWPRGGGKSSADHIDTVQWILAYPHVRILYLTAESSLSTGFMAETKGFFSLREDKPTLMNLFWPEHCCLDKDMRKGNVFVDPLWKSKKIKRKETTVIASSVGRTKSGWHFEVIKADDAVSDKNSQTETQCISISEQLDLAENLLIPSGDGFPIFFIGTRYHEMDHYGKLLDKFEGKGEIEVKKEGRGWKFVHNKSFNVDILIGRAVQIKPEVADRLSREGRPVTYIEAGESGCDLLLPNLISFSFFMGKFTKNERVTEGQLNQNPRPTSDVEFSKMLMMRATIPYMMLPRQGPVSQFWDFAFSRKKGRDYSTGTSVLWGEENDYGPDGKVIEDVGPDGRKYPRKKTVGYARKVIRERFNHLTLAQAIVQFAKEEHPFVIGIEDAAGSRLLEPTIIAEAARSGDPYVFEVCSRIDWVTPDNQVDAKRVRIRSLYPWVAEGRFKFLNACMQPDTMETLYSEFEKCLVSHHHEDIPDSFSYQTRYAPQATQAIVSHDTTKIVDFNLAGWNEVFNGEMSSAYYDDGSGNLLPWESPQPDLFTEFQPEPEIEVKTPNGMPNILGSGMFG